ncbi:hypothetical protein U1Q18_043509, partial [Sarracenia purpurea var. burkii]
GPGARTQDTNARTKQNPTKENSKHEEDTCKEAGESSNSGRSVSQGRRQVPAMVPSSEDVSGKGSVRQSPVKQAVTVSEIIGEISGEKDWSIFKNFRSYLTPVNPVRVNRQNFGIIRKSRNIWKLWRYHLQPPKSIRYCW